ncbi:MBL fold metallo-hydrolase [Streptomyces sp. TP-A0874]|uniref:MBL fold metallo-hydrolase n=1 Tax=Streptomyces sp. TP-A0874 TaxID=549819 RepID=UPI000AC642D9|nr:MBL fold metallo-hydrolase [Streptomyces sp. TP-A0874]
MSGAAGLPDPEFQEVADGVFAFVQPDGGWCLNNAGLLVSDGQAALIDTAATENRARLLGAAVRSVTETVPRTVVNTHFHGDHSFGNFVFAEDAVIVAHEACRNEMAVAGLGLQGLWPEVEWGEVTIALPSLTYRTELTLHVGELTARLSHPGPAHTVTDTVVWIPERSVLFTGDIVMNGTTPFCLMGSVSGSLRTIERLRSYGARTVVTGHGPVAGPEVFDTTEAYLRWLRRLAADGVRAGLSPLELAREADLGEFAGLLDSERLVANLHRAYAEERGAPPGAELDVAGIFAEMVEHHGALPLCRA